MNKCEFPHPRIRSTKLVVKKNLNSCWRISPCCNYLLNMWKENGRPLLYTLYFSWTQGCIAPCLFETGPMVLEMKNFECRHCNFTILPWSSSPWETVWHFIWANWTSKWFVPSLVEIALVVLHGKNMKNIKTDNWQQPINKLILSACELKRISSSKKWVLTHFLGKFLTMRLNFFSNGKIYFRPIVPGEWVGPSLCYITYIN